MNTFRLDYLESRELLASLFAYVTAYNFESSPTVFTDTFGDDIVKGVNNYCLHNDAGVVHFDIASNTQSGIALACNTKSDYSGIGFAIKSDNRVSLGDYDCLSTHGFEVQDALLEERISSYPYCQLGTIEIYSSDN